MAAGDVSENALLKCINCNFTVKEFFQFAYDIKTLNVCQGFQEAFHVKLRVVCDNIFYQQFCWAHWAFWVQTVELCFSNFILSTNAIPATFVV